MYLSYTVNGISTDTVDKLTGEGMAFSGGSYAEARHVQDHTERTEDSMARLRQASERACVSACARVENNDLTSTQVSNWRSTAEYSQHELVPHRLHE